MPRKLNILKSLQKLKYGEPHSPYTEKYDEEESGHKLSGNANYTSGNSNQKPEWKRYKQYTRQDLNDAIQAVKTGMSALQASRLFKVPSRTLYDKVKKMGIVGNRPINRAIRRSPSSNGGSPAAFPYGISGTRSPSAQFEAQSQMQSLNESENGGDMEQREQDLRNNLMTLQELGLVPDPNFLLKAMEREAQSLAAVNGIKNLVRPMSQSPPPVYQGSSTTAQSPPPASIHDDEEEEEDVKPM